jgi:hypothetical protein
MLMADDFPQLTGSQSLNGWNKLVKIGRDKFEEGDLVRVNRLIGIVVNSFVDDYDGRKKCTVYFLNTDTDEIFEERNLKFIAKGIRSMS